MARERLPLPKGVPKTLRFQSLTFDVLALGDGRLAFAHYEHGPREVVKKRSIEELRSAAEAIATRILNAETVAQELTADDRRMASAALLALAPTGIALDAAARDFAAAHELTNGSVSMTDLARFWIGRNPSRKVAPGSSVILDMLLARLADDRLSPEYQTGLKRDLVPFAARHPDLGQVSEEDVRAYLRSLVIKAAPGKPSRPVSDRRRDNVRDALVTLFRFAREKQFLGDEKDDTVAERVKRVGVGTDVSTYTPTELDLILSNASDRWRPVFAIAAFAGLRTSEIYRLTWDKVKWEKKVISISRQIAKKVRVSRLAPLSDQLASWIANGRNKTGSIFTLEQPAKAMRRNSLAAGVAGSTSNSLQAFYKAADRELERIEKITGVATRRNAFRHSYGSHRMAIVKVAAEVAHEMGTSPSQIREHYHDPKPEDEAIAYFGLQPPEMRDEHIILLPLQFAKR